MESKTSLPHSKQHATAPILSQFNPVHALPQFMKVHLVLSPYLRLRLSALYPSGFPSKTLCASFFFLIRSTCPAHPINLKLIAGIIFGEYRP